MSAEFWTKRGKFYNHVGTETLVRHRGLHAAQQPTYDQQDKASIRVRAKGDEEASCWRPQCLPGKSEGTAGRTTRNRPRRRWPDGPITTLLTKTEVLRGGQLDVDIVEGGETYLGAGRLYLREMRRLLHGRPTVTYNTY